VGLVMGLSKRANWLTCFVLTMPSERFVLKFSVNFAPVNSSAVMPLSRQFAKSG